MGPVKEAPVGPVTDAPVGPVLDAPVGPVIDAPVGPRLPVAPVGPKNDPSCGMIRLSWQDRARKDEGVPWAHGGHKPGAAWARRHDHVELEGPHVGPLACRLHQGEVGIVKVVAHAVGPCRAEELTCRAGVVVDGQLRDRPVAAGEEQLRAHEVSVRRRVLVLGTDFEL